MLRFRPLLALVAIAPLAGSPFAQQIVFDDFNRPSGTDMGPDWTEQNGDLVILANRGKGNLFLANDTWMSHNSFSQTYTNAKGVIDFQIPGEGEIGGGVGLALGLNTSSWGSVAILLQDNDLDGLFDRLFFNAAINAGAWFVGGSPVLYDLPSPLAAGQLTAWVQDGGDRAAVRVEDAAGNLVGVYTADDILASAFIPNGSSLGVWIRSRPFFDNVYGIEHRMLDAFPASVSVSAGGSQTLDLTFGSTHAGEVYAVAGSFSGTAPGTPFGPFQVPLNFDAYTTYSLTGAPPLSNSIGALDAIGHARASLTLPAGGFPQFAGLTIHHAAVALDPLGPTAVTNAGSLTLTP